MEFKRPQGKTSLTAKFAQAAKSSVKWATGLAGAFVLALGLTTAGVYKYGEELATDSFSEYSQKNGIPQEVVDYFPNNDKIRVYENNKWTHFYQVGQWTDYEVQARIDQDIRMGHLPEDGGLSTTWKKISYGAHAWAKYMATTDVENVHPLGAYALRLPTQDSCYINPAGDMTLSEFTSMFTGIHSDDLLTLDNDNEIDPKIPVMIHEAAHCATNTPPMSIIEAYMESHRLLGEAESDQEAYDLVEKHFEGTIMPELLQHIRAVAPLTSPFGVDAIHASTPLVDSPMNEGKEFSRADVYAAYVHLNEIVKEKTKGYHPMFHGPYWYPTYVVIKEDILKDPNIDITDATRHAAELYVKGIEYLVPALNPEMQQQQNAKPQEQKDLVDHIKNYILG